VTDTPHPGDDCADFDECPIITVGQHAYLNLADANAIASTRLFAEPWNNSRARTQEQALITATSLLDRMQWQGRKLAPTQPLAWPRVAERAPLGYPLTTEIPDAIKTASVELAIHLLATGSLGSGPAIMQRMLGDAMEMYYQHLADELPKHVRRLIEPYLSASSAHVAEVRF
jgi:hypothetical protein